MDKADCGRDALDNEASEVDGVETARRRQSSIYKCAQFYVAHWSADSEFSNWPMLRFSMSVTTAFATLS